MADNPWPRVKELGAPSLATRRRMRAASKLADVLWKCDVRAGDLIDVTEDEWRWYATTAKVELPDDATLSLAWNALRLRAECEAMPDPLEGLGFRG